MGQGVLRFTNIQLPFEWKDYHSLFSEFGKIDKLYIEPSGKFGRVFYNNIESALKAQEELDGKPPHNLEITRIDTILDSDISDKPNRKMAYRSNNEVTGYENSSDYVDVFGRVLNTVVSDEDGDIYVSSTELKKSGFEIFRVGTLPKQGELTWFDKQLYQQFENYLEMKAAKFIMRNNFQVSEDKVSHIFAKLRQKHMNYHKPDVAVANQNGMLTVTSPYKSSVSHERNDRGSWNNSQPRNSQGFNRSNNRSRDNVDNFDSQSSTSNRGRNTSDNSSFQGKGRWNNNNKPPINNQGLGGGRTYSTRNENAQNNRHSDFGRPKPPRQDNRRESMENPKVSSSFDCASLQKQGTDLEGPFWGESAKKGQTFDNVEKSETIPSLRQPIKAESKVQQPRLESRPSEIKQSQETKPIGKIEQSTPERRPSPTTVRLPEVVKQNQETKPLRELAIKYVSTNGLFQYLDSLTENTFIGAAMPTEYADQISYLEKIVEDIIIDPSFKPNIGDLVAVPKDKDEYVRGIVTSNSNNKYECALIDYGIIIEVDMVCSLPSKFEDIPEFACLCKATPQLVQELTKKGREELYTLEIKSPNKLTIIVEDKSYDIDGSKWDPLGNTKKQNTYKVHPESQLKNNEIVMIIAPEDNYLLVRTKETTLKFKEIVQEINSLLPGESLEKEPEVNQMVLSLYNNTYYRAKVTSVDNSNASVYYIDYGNSEKVPIKSLKNVNEKLSNINNTLLKVKLKGFVNQQFGSKALQFLNECCERREKLTAVTSGDDTFDLLFKDKSSMSEKLMALDKTATQKSIPTDTLPEAQTTPTATATESIIQVADIPKYALQKGKNSAMCLYAGDLETSGIVVFCSTDDPSSDIMTDLPEKIKQFVAIDNQPYTPQKNEVCLAQFDGEWYRAAYLLDADDDKFGMFYIDYGNTQEASVNDLRKMPKELADVKCCACVCMLDGLPMDGDQIKAPVLTALKDLLEENNLYEIDVIEESDCCYFVKIPEVYSSLKQKGLV